MTDSDNERDTIATVTEVSSVFGDGPHERIEFDPERFTGVPPILDEKEDGAAYIGALFHNGSRLREAIEQVTLLVYDLDDVATSVALEVVTRLQNHDLDFVLHTTWSHDPEAGTTAGLGRYRLILFPERAMSVSDHRETMQQLAMEHQIPFAPESLVATQPMFYPAVSDEAGQARYAVRRSAARGRVTVLEGRELTVHEERGAFGAVLPVPPVGDVPNALFIGAVLSVKAAAESTRTEWLNMGAAIHHQTRGEDEGLALWTRWSSEDTGTGSDGKPRYTGSRECRRIWERWSEESHPNPLTMRTILRWKHRGQDYRPQVYAKLLAMSSSITTMDRIIDSARGDDRLGTGETNVVARAYAKQINTLEPDAAVPIRPIDVVSRMRDARVAGESSLAQTVIDRHVLDLSLNSPEFIDRLTGQTYRSTPFNLRWGHVAPSRRSGDRYDLARCAAEGSHGVGMIEKVYGRVYAPGKPRVIQTSGGTDKIFNQFDAFTWPVSAHPFDSEENSTDSEIARRLTCYYRLLSGDRPDVARWLISHLAHLRQHPSIRIRVALAIASRRQGIGKSTLTDLYRTVLGSPQISTVNNTAIAQERENTFLAAPCMVTFGEEIRLNKLDPLILERLKEGISQDEGKVKAMGEGSFSRKFTSCYVFTSNDPFMLGKESAGRRFTLITIPEFHVDEYREMLGGESIPEFYRRFHALLASDGDRFVAYFDQQGAISPEFSSHRALMTREKESYVDNSPVGIITKVSHSIVIASRDALVQPTHVYVPVLVERIRSYSFLESDNQAEREMDFEQLQWAIKQAGHNLTPIAIDAVRAMGYSPVDDESVSRRASVPGPDGERAPRVSTHLLWVKRAKGRARTEGLLDYVRNAMRAFYSGMSVDDAELPPEPAPGDALDYDDEDDINQI